MASNQQDQNNQQKALINRAYQYNPAGNIIERATEKGQVNYRYDLLDRLTEAKPEKALQDLGLPDEAYTYDAIGNRLGSRHQPGQFEYTLDNMGRKVEAIEISANSANIVVILKI